VAQQDCIGAEPLPHGIEQHQMQIAAVHGKLGPVVAGKPPTRLAVDKLTKAIVETHFACLDCA
jgi:hypothetical protein